jgi:hypothetical protein
VRRLHCLFGLLWALGLATCAAQTFEQGYRMKARDLFVALERAARLPIPQQGQEIARIYRDVWPVLNREMLTAMTINAAHTPNGRDERNVMPEELAAVYEQQGGWPSVAEAARVRCRRLLAAHAKEVEGLAWEELESRTQDVCSAGYRLQENSG